MPILVEGQAQPSRRKGRRGLPIAAITAVLLAMLAGWLFFVPIPPEGLRRRYTGLTIFAYDMNTRSEHGILGSLLYPQGVNVQRSPARSWLNVRLGNRLWQFTCE